MGRGRYNSHDHRQQDDDYEDQFSSRYTNAPDTDDRYIYDDEEEYEARARRRPSPSKRGTSSRRPLPPQRKRSVWPALLGGCALGVFLVVLAAALVVIFAVRNLQGGGSIANIPGVISMKSFSKEERQQLPPTQFSQVLVCDQVGNVTLRVDPTITKPVVALKKTVRAANQNDANKAFQQIGVEVQPPNTITHPLTCARSQATPTVSSTVATPSVNSSTSASATGAAATLTVNVLFPNSDVSNHSVDLNIALPPGALVSDNGPSIPVNVEAPIGDITVDGLSGVLNIRGGTGNVTVKHAILVDGSHIETAQGNVIFNGYLAAPPTDSSAAGNGQTARYIIQSEHDVDVTLPDNTNVLLDANTNVGKITSDFPITVTNENGAMSYHGPLNAASPIKSSATLVLDVSTGNVAIHKSTA
ncbi:MAG: hypothetical protein H0U76_08375 [Ktedonobacteraceae bacterium]|nr:hypothetical protein [Ktedonobacteraceae bacterium]